MLLDDHKAAELITVITTTHPICTVPSDEHLYLAQASLFINPTLAKSKKIIVFDGVAPGFKDRCANYDLYKKKLNFCRKPIRFLPIQNLYFVKSGSNSLVLFA